MSRVSRRNQQRLREQHNHKIAIARKKEVTYYILAAIAITLFTWFIL